MVVKNFQIYVTRLLKNAFVSQKIESRHFTLAPLLAKLSLRFLSSPPEENYSSPQALFFQKSVSPAERGR